MVHSIPGDPSESPFSFPSGCRSIRGSLEGSIRVLPSRVYPAVDNCLEVRCEGPSENPSGDAIWGSIESQSIGVGSGGGLFIGPFGSLTPHPYSYPRGSTICQIHGHYSGRYLLACLRIDGSRAIQYVYPSQDIYALMHACWPHQMSVELSVCQRHFLRSLRGNPNSKMKYQSRDLVVAGIHDINFIQSFGLLPFLAVTYTP